MEMSQYMLSAKNMLTATKYNQMKIIADLEFFRRIH